MSATRLTVVTLRPSAPPAPISRPLADIRWPANESRRVSDELEGYRPAAEGPGGVLRHRPRALGPLRDRRTGQHPIASTPSQAPDDPHKRVGR